MAQNMLFAIPTVITLSLNILINEDLQYLPPKDVCMYEYNLSWPEVYWLNYSHISWHSWLTRRPLIYLSVLMENNVKERIIRSMVPRNLMAFLFSLRLRNTSNVLHDIACMVAACERLRHSGGFFMFRLVFKLCFTLSLKFMVFCSIYFD